MMNKYNFRLLGTKRRKFHNRKEVQEDLQNYKLKPMSFSEYTHKNLLKKNYLNLSSVIIERSILRNYLFDQSNSLSAVEDYDLWLKITKTQKQKYMF